MDHIDLSHPKEAKRQLEMVKVFLTQLSQGYSLEQQQDLFVAWNQQEQNEQLKSVSYQLLNSIKAEQSVLLQIVQQDLTSPRQTCLLNTLSLLQCLDYASSAELIKQQEKSIL